MVSKVLSVMICERWGELLITMLRTASSVMGHHFPDIQSQNSVEQSLYISLQSPEHLIREGGI